jgi:hypothetical protein
MPGWPRLVLFAAGMGVAWINGIETSRGVLDFLGGVLILAAIFWPGCMFITSSPGGETVYELGRRRAGWPSPREVREALAAYGSASDGLVVRQWTMPFPATWVGVRDYSTSECPAVRA